MILNITTVNTFEGQAAKHVELFKSKVSRKFVLQEDFHMMKYFH